MYAQLKIIQIVYSVCHTKDRIHYINFVVPFYYSTHP